MRSNGVTGTVLTFKLETRQKPLTQRIFVDWLQASNNADEYQLRYEPRYWLSEQVFASANASIRAFDSLNLDNHNRTLGVGLGRQLISSETSQLVAEATLNNLTSVREATLGNTRISDSEVFAGVKIDGSHLLSDSILLNLDTDYQVSEDSSLGVAEAGIALKIVNGGSIKYAYRYQRSALGDLAAVSDSSSSVSVGYSF